MHILILGDRTDPHAAHLYQATAQTGTDVHYWDTKQFPRHMQLSWQPHLNRGTIVLPEGHQLDLNQIHSVFWRSFLGVEVPLPADSEQYQIALNDSVSVLRSLLQVCPARWFNSWQAYQFHKEKPLQLLKVQQLGVSIPATLVSNDSEEILSFCKLHDRTICKPVYGGSHTQFVTADHLDKDRLELALQIAPVTIQEYIAGTNIRSYVIGEAVYSAEIRSHSVDFRTDTAAELIPITLPAAIEQASVKIARSLMLQWTAIDWRRMPDNTYVFLEANPSPMFLYFEQQTGFPITASLVDRLLAQD